MTLLLLAGNLNFKFRIVFWNISFLRFGDLKNESHFLKNKPPLGFLPSLLFHLFHPWRWLGCLKNKDAKKFLKTKIFFRVGPCFSVKKEKTFKKHINIVKRHFVVSYLFISFWLKNLWFWFIPYFFLMSRKYRVNH